MPTATANRPPKARKPVKPVRVLNYKPFDGRLGLLTIKVTTGDATVTDAYWIEAANAARDTFRVRKHAPMGSEGYESAYLTCIRPGAMTCGCRGFEHCKTSPRVCRHVASVLKLRDLGKI